MKSLTPTPKDLFFSKNDPEDVRLGDWVLNPPLSKQSFHILGYPDDEGIRLNKGRPGAEQAPNIIRNFFYRMTPAVLNSELKTQIKDHGNIPTDISLIERHEMARTQIAEFTRNRQIWISLGGGHDYGYADAMGFLDGVKDSAPVVINVDAHLDVRPDTNGPNSGTPFYRTLMNAKKKFQFIEYGIQPQCNSQSHLAWLKNKKGSVIDISSIRKQGPLKPLRAQLRSQKKIFLSLDIDAFAASAAPGCSQSWESGLTWMEWQPVMEYLIQKHDVCGMGIYEVSPPLDQDNRTSKLAALLMHEFVFQTLRKKNG